MIDEDGKQYGIVPIEEALRIANERYTDLVEVAPQADPPVCKLMDYGKFKYLQKKKLHQAKKKHHTARIKEIRFNVGIEEHDLLIKINRAREFLERGDKLLLRVTFRGRQTIHKEIGKQLLDKCLAELEPVSRIEKPVTDDGRTMTTTLVPKAASKS